jgi:uncharacterized protein with NAD-binding domain and iron-sulfur cluster
LGGGLGSLVSAYALLSSQPRGSFEVSVHALGHRLGGKCATGRGANGRIEEHGIHMFFGGYRLAWRTFGRVFRDWAQPPSYPLATLDRAFEPSDGLTLCERVDGEWRRFPIRLPRRGPPPWEQADDGSDDVPPVDAAPTRWVRDLVSFVDAWIASSDGVVSAAVAGVWRRARRLFAVALRASEAAENVLARALAAVLADASRRLVAGWDVLAREGLAVAVAVARGLLRDRPARFADLDDWEFRDWLCARGGLDPSLADCAVVRAVYVSGFARDASGREDLAAGAAIAAMARTLLRYQGSCGYHFRSATGDVLFVPLYEVLRDKFGVRFHFFHEVTRLRADDEGVSAIEVDVRATPRDGEYRPLASVAGLRAWPSAPLLDQLEDGERLRGRDLESHWDGGPPASRLTLERGRDFDAVILGIPVGALGGLTTELAERSPRWRAMLEGVRTTPTFCVSVWWQRSAAELGARPPPYASRLDVATYARPMPLLLDFSQTLWSEGEGSGRHVVYLSDAWTPREAPAAASDAAYPARAKAELVRAAATWFDEHLAWLYPRAVTRGAEGRTSLDHAALVAPDALRGEARFAHQWFRVNVDPSERYVLSVTGSARHRLPPDASGFDNLFLAGDWTDDGINFGCVEATVRSALVSARGLARWAQRRRGEDRT